MQSPSIFIPIARCLLLTLSIFWLCASAFARENTELVTVLLKMKTQDQAVREVIKQSGVNLSQAQVDRITDTDAKHTRQLKAIISEHGWPSVSLVGKDGVQAAFLLVQHSPDIAFQKAMLPHILHAYQNNQGITGQEVALLTDRVLVKTGQPQKYGTQADITSNTVTFFPIADADNVDKRRAEMGLPPLTDYKEILEQLYAK